MNLTKPQKLIYDMERFAGGTINVICGCMLLPGIKPEAELIAAVIRVFQLNDALRIRIIEEDGQPSQQVIPYTEKNIEVLYFASKAELDSYAQDHATVPFDFHGDLCDIKVLILPGQYGLLVKFHHIVGDAWTIALIGTQFNAIMNGEEPSACSYCEYAESEKTYLASQRYENDRTFFLEQFKKCDEVTYLSEKQVDSYSATRKTFVLNAAQTQQIKDYATQNKTSPYTLFMTVLAVYMNRTKMNTEKFYLGTAVLNRSGAREKRTMGMFINTVPMLMELENEKSLAENLATVGKTVFSAFRHQKFNYGDVLSAIRKEHNFTEKLYDVVLSYQNATITGGDCETTWYHCGMQNESLQIHIDDRDNEGVFRIHYDYQTDKFSSQEIDRLHQHLMTLLLDAIANDGKMLYELDLLTPDEKQTILYDFNDTAMDYPKDKCVHQLFEEQVERTPDKVAVIACDKTLTYAELNEQANRIAHSLIHKGVGVGDIVAFALSRKSHLISAILGILKSGAAYLPIDPDYPQDRIDYILKDSNANQFITESEIEDYVNNNQTENPAVAITSEDLCYCIYTSGSTGNAKGVMLGHANVNYYLNNVLSIYGAKPVNMPLFTSPGVDLTVTSIYLPLLTSGAIYLYNKDVHESLCEIIENKHLSTVKLTPTHIKLLNSLPSYRTLGNVNGFIVGGEALYYDDAKLLRDKYGKHIAIHNEYGPTETTVGCCDFLFDELETCPSVSIGKPIANTQIYIADKHMCLVPIGVTGELCIAGDGVGAGYLNRPELTAEKFIDNPFGEGKLYKTGDLAYWREDGNIAYVGRNDFQVKIRGLRIELGEIENALVGIDGISQAVVVVRKNSEGRQLICAFYTGEEMDAKSIRSHIGKKLPKYMLPHIFTHLSEMPLTSSGKVNRKALPEVDLYAIDNAVEYVAPTTEQEKVLASAVEAVLGCDKVGILDNFFDVGGDSLKVIELISKLEKQGYHTDTKTIFECDTVKELAERLTAAERSEEVFEYSGDIPATDAQMRVYTAQSMHSDSTTYNVPYVFRAETVDPEKLQYAVDAMIARHESLRTHFENKDGQIIQVINNTAQCSVEKLSTDDITAFIHPFDLSKVPLLRVGYYENTVMIDMHHIITDGSSMPVFLRELNELYMGRPVENNPVQYKQFAIQKQDHSESEKYWLSVYGDEVPVLEINTDFHRGQKQSFNGGAIYDTVDINLHHQIVAFCKKQNITPYVFYMGAFNILLSKFSGSEDIVVGIPISGRSGKYLDTIGMFVNTIALRNQPVSTKTVADFLQEVKVNSVAAMDHQDYPYGQLVKKLHLDTLGRNPLFDVMFAYQSEQMTDAAFGDQKAELLPIPITTSKYDFTFNIMPRQNDVVIMAEYCTDLYRDGTMQRFVNGYKLILAQLMDSKFALKNITALSEHERQRLLYEFNDTAVDYPKDKCVHQLFEEQAAKTPDGVALKFGNKAFSFAELNGFANSLAVELQKQGVSNGDIVAIIAKRSYHIVVAMLAIFKCGAAYLPIDYNYPEDRINTIATDANCKAILTYDVDYSADNVIAIPENITPIEANPICKTNPKDICGIIYTSGSTGTPKGTLLHHQGLVNYTFGNDALYEGGGCNIGFAIYTFDAFFLDLIPPMLRGKTAVMATEEEQFNQIAFENLIKNNPDCNLFITPAKFKQFVDNRRDIDFFKRIHSICIGGEVFPQEFIGMFSESTKVYNVYGPTECSMWMLECPVVNEDVTLGKPMSNVQVYILDKHNKVTPVGVTGELSIAGDGVGAGYLNRPELTAEKFIDNPFGEGKLYKTGDLAY